MSVRDYTGLVECAGLTVCAHSDDQEMVDRMADRSVVRQVADALRADITSGALPVGAPLPSEATIVQRFEVARATARAAVAILRAEGLVVTYSGRGSFVREPAPVETISIGRDAIVTARAPSETERRTLGLVEGVPVLVVTSAGGDERVLPADRTALVYGE